MKKVLLISIAAILLFSFFLGGCDLSLMLDQLLPKAAEAEPEVPTTEPEPPTTVATEPPTEPTEPLSTSFPYLQEIPAEACIFREPNPDSAFVQTVGSDGTYTIVAEERSADGDRWGRLKSGVGWVNLTDFLCDGAQLPPVTGSHTGKIMKNRDCICAYTHGSSTSYRTFSFVAHETVTNVSFIHIWPVDYWEETIYTLDQLTPDKPLVITGYMVEFDYLELRYTDASGQRHTISIRDSFVEPVTNFHHS